MSAGFDVSELLDFEADLRRAATSAPKKTKQFMRREGSKLTRRTKTRAKQMIGKNHKKPKKYAGSKHYVDTIKRSKLFRRSDGSLGVSAYSSARHAHLIEYGHNLYVHGNPTGKFVHGKFVFEREYLAYRNTFVADTEDFFDDVLSEVES